jgi:hypothetical protein
VTFPDLSSWLQEGEAKFAFDGKLMFEKTDDPQTRLLWLVLSGLILCMAVCVEAQPLIAVRDVRASSRWYGKLLAADSLPDHRHRDFYDRVYSSGRLILQLHAWDEEQHPNLVNADAAPHGHGVLLWFQVDDFDGAVARGRELGAEVVLEPYFNPAPKHREIWLRDRDGYVVVIAGPDGEGS